MPGRRLGKRKVKRKINPGCAGFGFDRAVPIKEVAEFKYRSGYGVDDGERLEPEGARMRVAGVQVGSPH